MLMTAKLEFTTRKTIIATLMVIMVVVGVVIILVAEPLSRDTTSREVVIPTGTGVRSIATLLKNEGVIKSRYLFIFYVTLSGQDTNLKAGRYLLAPSLSVSRVASIIAQGLSESDDVVVTLPEGMNVWETEKKLQQAGFSSAGFAKSYYLREGHLFPDTYAFKKDAADAEIAALLEQTFTDKVGTITPRQLIIASLLEKEAKTETDMALVAGIIEKRISLGMALQVDATVTYGWCLGQSIASGFKSPCDVTQAPLSGILKQDGAFNTYTRIGLPPRPISNPGLKAIYAATHPTASDYLYYLSTRDGQQIIYAKTGAEHLANRRKYLGF